MNKKQLTDILTENDRTWRENDYSIITRCPQCGKQDCLYIFKGENRNNSKCIRCGAFYTPANLIIAIIGCSYDEAHRLLREDDLNRSNGILGGLEPQTETSPASETTIKVGQAPNLLLPEILMDLKQSTIQKRPAKYRVVKTKKKKQCPKV